MQESGWGKGRVRKALREAHDLDFSFASGAVLGSMCTEPHPLAAEAYRLFMETNLGDPDHFPGTAVLEAEVLEDLRVLLHAPQKAAGRFLSGGTEANLLAMYVAREKTGKRKVVLPEHAHFSFEKAARMLDMELVWIPSGEDHKADVAGMEAAMDTKTALAVGVAGSTELGLVDDLSLLARTCKKAGVRLHVDAAFGGYVLPFLEGAGRTSRPFDFALPGVWSLSLDPHKMGMATIPGGVLLLRDGRDWDAIAVQTPYVSTETHSQIMGTRPGAAAASAWAVHRALGRDGFTDVVRTCLDNAQHLAARLLQQDVQLVDLPELNVVTFRHPDAVGLMQRLQAHGIRVNVVPRHEAIRIVVGPHVDRKAIETFLAVLTECWDA